jgi:hypothetical protein
MFMSREAQGAGCAMTNQERVNQLFPEAHIDFIYIKRMYVVELKNRRVIGRGGSEQEAWDDALKNSVQGRQEAHQN